MGGASDLTDLTDPIAVMTSSHLRIINQLNRDLGGAITKRISLSRELEVTNRMDIVCDLAAITKGVTRITPGA